MAVKSDFKHMVICLFVTCLICSTVLGVVYAVTKAPIDQTNANILKASISAVLPEGGELSEAQPAEVGGLPSEYYVSKDSEGNPVAYAIKSVTTGFGGALQLMVGITADGKIHNTSVLSHSETPGLGAKCTFDNVFVSQWKGFDPSEKILKVKKDNGDVDAITASTITSRAYTLAVANAVEAFNKIKGE